MTFVHLRKTLITCLLLGAPTALIAQPADYADHYDTSVSGEAVVSVDVFYDQLTPYGAWVDDPALGHVFTPESADFVPYTVGHWQYTDVGFVWISAQPFDWATAHYGRWAYSTPYSRWVWLPDTTWGPSWVEWRQSGDDFGWAPLAPEVAISAGYSAPIESWHYCGSAHLLDANVTRYYEPRERVVVIHRAAQPMEHYAQISGVRVVVGPSAAVLHEHHVEARPVKLEAHAIGRWTPQESVAQAKRAEERKPANDELNKKRIDGNTKLHQATIKVAATTPNKAPQIKEPPKPEPKQVGKPEPKQEIKQEPKQVVKPTPGKPEYKPEPKAEPKQVAKPAPAKPEYKPEPKAEPKQVVKPPPAKPESKPEPRPEPKQVVKPAPAKPESKPEPRPEPKQVVKPAPAKPESRPEPRPEPKQVAPAKPEYKPEPKPAPKQVEPTRPVEHAPAKPSAQKPGEK
jgi:hypothetical protein